MSVQDEYEMLVDKVSALEGVNVVCAKKALTEILDERYGSAPNALRYRAFTDLDVAQVERAKRYLRVYLQSNRFKQDFPEMAWLIFGK